MGLIRLSKLHYETQFLEKRRWKWQLIQSDIIHHFPFFFFFLWLINAPNGGDLGGKELIIFEGTFLPSFLPFCSFFFLIYIFYERVNTHQLLGRLTLALIFNLFVLVQTKRSNLQLQEKEYILITVNLIHIYGKKKIWRKS